MCFSKLAALALVLLSLQAGASALKYDEMVSGDLDVVTPLAFNLTSGTLDIFGESEVLAVSSVDNDRFDLSLSSGSRVVSAWLWTSTNAEVYELASGFWAPPSAGVSDLFGSWYPWQSLMQYGIGGVPDAGVLPKTMSYQFHFEVASAIDAPATWSLMLLSLWSIGRRYRGIRSV